MKVRPSVALLLAIFLLVGMVPIRGHTADQDRQSLETLLADLEKKIKEADQRKAANPKFLEDLRALVKQYRSKLRVVYISEDLADGDYRNNPTWIVSSGNFQVTGSHRLHSEVPVEQPATSPSASDRSSPLGTILKEVLRPTTQEGKGRGTPSTPAEARIQTLAGIGPDFEVDLTMVSRSSWGSMEIVLSGGTQTTPLYRMVYQASPSSERPIQIIRERDGKSYLIDTATQYPSLDDGVPHRLQWIRTSQGQMWVMVDGKEVLSTSENYYRSNFSGLALVNKGGTYEWGPISVLQAIETKAQ